MLVNSIHAYLKRYKKAILVTALAKIFGVIRELLFFSLSIISPTSVNLYFIAAQTGIGMGEGALFKIFYLFIAASIGYSFGVNILLAFLLIAVPFFFWPKLLESVNKKVGLKAVVLISIIFNALAIAEIVLSIGFKINPVTHLEGAPVFSLWLTVVGGALLFGLNKPSSIDKSMATILCGLVAARLIMLIEEKTLTENYYLLAALRAMELIVPQFANYHRIFKRT